MIAAQTPTGLKNLFLRGVRTPAGNKLIGRASILTPEGSKEVWSTTTSGGGVFSASALPSSVSGAAAVGGTTAINTSYTDVAAEGAAGAVTYDWTIESSDGGAWQANQRTSAKTNFQQSSVNAGVTSTATFKCTVTDELGRTAVVTVDARVRNYGDSSVAPI